MRARRREPPPRATVGASCRSRGPDRGRPVPACDARGGELVEPLIEEVEDLGHHVDIQMSVEHLRLRRADGVHEHVPRSERRHDVRQRGIEQAAHVVDDVGARGKASFGHRGLVRVHRDQAGVALADRGDERQQAPELLVHLQLRGLRVRRLAADIHDEGAQLPTPRGGIDLRVQVVPPSPEKDSGLALTVAMSAMRSTSAVCPRAVRLLPIRAP